MMATFRIFGIFPIVCLNLAAGGNHQFLGRMSSFQCPSMGFHPDPNDCRIFYRCVDWNSNVFGDYNELNLTPFQFTCGEGTVFDPEYNICNRPDRTLRKECATRAGGEESEGSSTNNQYPFTYTPSMMSSGEYYPANEIITNYPESYPNEYENQIPSDIEMIKSPSTECPGEGFFPVPGDCNRFMRCVDDGMGGYRKYVFMCGEGTVWDQKNLVCNYPGSVAGAGGSESNNNIGQYADGNPSEYPQNWYPGDNQQGNTVNQPGYPREIYPDQGGNQVQQPREQPVGNRYPDTQGNQAGYTATDIRLAPENRGYGLDQSEYSSQGYPEKQSQRGYPRSGNQNHGQNQGYPQQWQGQGNEHNQYGYPQRQNKPPLNELNQGSRPDQYDDSSHGYTSQQKQGNYLAPGNRPRLQNHGNGQLPSQQNYSNRPDQFEYPQQDGFSGQQNHGGHPTHGNQLPGQNQENPQRQHGNNAISNKQSQGNWHDQSTHPQHGGYPIQNRPQNQSGDQGFGASEFGFPQEGGYPQQFGYLLQQGNEPDHSTNSQHGDHPNGTGQPYPQQGYFPDGSLDGDNSMDGPSECQGDGFFSVPNDCMKFYRCVRNIDGRYMRYDFTCGPGTVWDPDKAACNHPVAVQKNECPNKIPQGADMNGGASPDQQHSGIGQNPPPSPTTISPNQQTPNQNQMFPQPTQSQQPSPNQNQISVQPIPEKQTTSTPNQIPTQNISTQTPESQTTQMEAESATDGSLANQTDTPPGSKPCQPDNNQPVKCEKEGFYPVPGNCKKFYRCADWDGDSNRFSTYFFECGEGTIWDPALQTCNHGESVYPPRDCSGDQNSQATSLTTTPQATTERTTIESTIPVETNTTPQDELTSSRPGESTSQTTDYMTTMEMTTGQTPEEKDKTTEPDNQNPTEPSSSYPTESSSDSSTEPNSDSPTETSSDISNEPNSSIPTDPVTYNPTEPGDTDPTQPSTDEDNSQTDPSENGERRPDCPATENGQVIFVCPTGFRRHPKDCNLFYQCTISKEGDVNIMTFTCQNESLYDERKIQCLPPEETSPCRNKENGSRRSSRRFEREMASVVPIYSSGSLCPREGHFPYDEDCQMFFKCKKDDRGRMQGYLYQCQPKHTFSPTLRRCERTLTVKKCATSVQYLAPTSLKWMTSKVPIEYFDVR